MYVELSLKVSKIIFTKRAKYMLILFKNVLVIFFNFQMQYIEDIEKFYKLYYYLQFHNSVF